MRATAIVTGAGRGIGRAIAARLARLAMKVALLDVNLELAETAAAELRANGTETRAYRVDLHDVSRLPGMVEQIASEWGSLDVLVNNAGIMRITPLVDVTEAEWDDVLGVNLKAAFFCLQACARIMIGQGRGRIVNIASISGLGARPDHVHYAAAKAGLISVTQSAALALAPHGITVNAVVPGIVDTPMQREVQMARGARLGVSVEEAMARAAENVPLGRLATPEDVAEAVAFLISPEAGYMTGQLLVMDGGVQLRGLPGTQPSVAQPKAQKRENG